MIFCVAWAFLIGDFDDVRQMGFVSQMGFVRRLRWATVLPHLFLWRTSLRTALRTSHWSACATDTASPFCKRICFFTVSAGPVQLQSQCIWARGSRLDNLSFNPDPPPRFLPNSAFFFKLQNRIVQRNTEVFLTFLFSFRQYPYVYYIGIRLVLKFTLLEKFAIDISQGNCV